ncbi:uncharacterized protein BDV17DRAFT_279122 [Aspergillus undulatus]|uniref:uncharacterized protein n=1 Tax=Aspergillus undulatus TaxID=1810928 RepID=UPI003CCDD4E2
MTFHLFRLGEIFSLVDHNGQLVTNTDLHGKHSLIFFGFTNCAVICSRALERLSQVLSGLGPASEEVNVFYISVDPDRDTPDIMKAFLKQMFHVFARPKRDANAPGEYVVPHTTITYLLDIGGTIVDHFNDALDAEAVTVRVLKAVSSGKASDCVGNGSNARGSFVYEQESLQRLDRQQVALIRHIGNLAHQLKDDWSNMMGAADINDGFGAYRYQLAFAYYALTLAHFHRLPVAPGFFKETMQRMIAKLIEPDVWFHWHDASTGGGNLQTPAREMIYDPIVTDNIMYSGYILVMSAMYNSLFNDDRYTKPGALTFEYDAFFWGPARASRYLSVACEPWCIFQVCNQMPILGFRLNDALATSGEKNFADGVTKGYVKAWAEKSGGILTPEGIFNTFYMKHVNQTVVVPGASAEAWTGLLMHAWNHELVQQTYDNRRETLAAESPDGSLTVNISAAITAMPRNKFFLNTGGIWGWVAAWAGETGDEETKNRLLHYADNHFHPRTQNGGLMYPRNDTVFDQDGNFVMVSPILSNSIIPLTRLNFRHGLKRLYENPWGARNRDHYDQPALVEVDFTVDVYRAVYLPEERNLLFDIALADYEAGLQGSVVLGREFGRKNWVLTRESHEIGRGSSDGLPSAETWSRKARRCACLF